MDILKEGLWQNCEPFGTLPNGTPGVVSPDMTIWQGGMAKFYALKMHTKGWKWNDEWTQKIYEYRDYRFGSVISKAQYHFGSYKAIVELPNFRGAWPAMWFIDITGQMGIPPEIDWFEHFRKDGWLSRFRLSCTYHDGPVYGKSIGKPVRSCTAWDKHAIVFEFNWTSSYMQWKINGKEIMTVYESDVKVFPKYPMNIIMGTGIGNWEPENVTNKPFIVRAFSYKTF